MARQDFIDQLSALGYAVRAHAEGQLAFAYTIPVGRFAERQIELGFQVGDDFPLNPPSGPHISPHLLPLHPAADLPHPQGGVHLSPLGADWQYWSRPYPNWHGTDRSVRSYLAHIRHLFETQ